MRVLFLDFDGVLHPADVWLEPDGTMRLGDSAAGHSLFEHALLLEDALDPYEDVRVVLSTSWVWGRGFDFAVASLPPRLAAKVIGATFDPAMHGAGFSEVARGYQIQSDARRRNLVDWIALDDDARDWPDEDAERLIRTHSFEGLAGSGVLDHLHSWLAGRGTSRSSQIS